MNEMTWSAKALSRSRDETVVHLPLPLKHVECLVGVLDQIEIRLGGNTDSVTDCRHASPVDELRGE